MDLLKENIHAPTHQLLETVYEQGLVPMITKPTRITPFSATLIDNILVDQQLQSSADSGILLEHLSDHLPCYCILRNINPQRAEELEITSRDTRQKNLNALKRKLQDATALETRQTESAENQFNEFHRKLDELLDQFIPVKTRKITKRKKRIEPWLTAGLEISIRRCKSLYKKHIKDRTNEQKYLKYLRYNQQLKRTKRLAKRKYYMDTCESNKNNTKQLWRTINQVIRKCNNKTEVIEKLKIDSLDEYNGEKIANELARYFSSVGKNYAKQMKKPKSTLGEYVNKIPRHPSSIFMTPITSTEIRKLIQTLPSKNSSGTDNISNKILKEIGEYLVNPLAQIFNKSLETGEFPSKMKLAKVVPLFKSKMRDEPTNYHPISLLLTLSKLLEKTVYSRVYLFLNETNQLYSSQYGFRKQHACEHAVGELIGKITKGIQQDKATAGIFLESKAFDSLEHEAIFIKLERYGLRGNCLQWFKSYLSNRKLLVLCRTSSSTQTNNSNMYDVEYGTAQGSCLGPLIFLVFCNDLHRHLFVSGMHTVRR